jgi:CheY-like chemotaxis protein
MAFAELLSTGFFRSEQNMPVVLIVDDDHAFRAVVRTLFESGSGFDACVGAGDGAEALEKAKQVSPNLAVLDFSMPEMNG